MSPFRFFMPLSALCLCFLAGLPLRAQTDPDPVLLIVASQDIYYPDYILPRQALEAAGLNVTVAAPQAGLVTSWGNEPDVTADLAFADVNPDQFSALVIVGGWGASELQYAFSGTYHNADYNGDPLHREQLNTLINTFHTQDKTIGAICYGITVFAWARIDGVSPVAGRDVVGYFGNSPGFNYNGDDYSVHTSWHVLENGGNWLPEGSVGNPNTSADDVIVDGNFVFGESFRCGTAFGNTIAAEVFAWHDAQNPTQLPVLLVLANDGFYYREYSETRLGLENQGLEVVITAGNLDWCYPHANTGQGAENGWIMPDLALADVDAADYAAIAFIGGWGSSHYQYAFTGSYSNGYYNSNAHRALANQVINDFVDQDKIISAICFGVTVLAWSRVDGQSPITGKDVSTFALGGPSGIYDGIWYGNYGMATTWHITQNGGTHVPSGSIGDPSTVDDDVLVDFSNGLRVITAENYDAALAFGTTLGAEILAE